MVKPSRIFLRKKLIFAARFNSSFCMNFSFRFSLLLCLSLSSAWLTGCGEISLKEPLIPAAKAKESGDKKMKKMKVEIWSDIMCPFCYIGKRNFEAALQQFENKSEVEIEWKSYQLDPSIVQDKNRKVTVYEYLAERKGMSLEHSKQLHDHVVQMAKSAGLDYHFEKAIVANSMDAHRLIQKAKEKNLGDEAEELLFSAYFVEGKDCGDKKVLSELGKTIGLSEADIQDAFSNDLYAYKVKQDIQEGEAKGLGGVPFFVINGKQIISGAQPPSVFLEALRK